jgi:hypothetical protein
MGAGKKYNIFYDEEIEAVIMNWYGYATSEEFREGTEFMVKLLEESKSRKVLANVKEMILIAKEDQDWLDKAFLPKTVELGLQATAVIMPTNYFNKIAVESISYKIAQQKIVVNYFEDLQKAKDWLQSV